MPPSTRSPRRPPAWMLVIGVLVLLLGVAWAVREGPVSNPLPTGGDPATAASGTTSSTATTPAEPPQPSVTPQRRAIARMSLKRLAVTNGGGRQRLVALTFDDGPGPLTMDFLALLNRLDVPATFYVQGGLVERYPAEMKAIVAGGHELGGHSWSHLDLTRTHGDEFRRQIFDTQAVIREVAGVDPATMRPPYGAIDDRVLREAAPTRMLQVLWDVDTNDWRGKSAAEISAHVLDTATAGSIVLMHDGGDARQATLRSLPAIIEGLRAKGVEFVTVSDLLLRDPPRELRDDPAPVDQGTSTDGSEVSAPGPGPSSNASASDAEG